MPVAVDEQIHYLGGLIQAKLNAVAAGSCVDVYEYPPDEHKSPPRTRFPCLDIYRTTEDFERKGTNARRARKPVVIANYYLGPKARAHVAAAFATLADVAQYIDDIVEIGHLSTYESDDTLETLAGIYEVHVDGVEYLTSSEDDGGPYMRITFSMLYEYSRAPTDAEELELLVADLNLDGDEDVVKGHFEIDFTSP